MKPYKFEDRLEEIAKETGQPLNQVIETQLDDSNLSGFKRLGTRAKRLFRDIKYPLAILGITGAIFGAGLLKKQVLERELTPLAWYDRNGDGVQDAIVAFPLRGTEKAVVRWIDGNTLLERGVNVPTEETFFQTNPKTFRINYFSTEGKNIPFQLIGDFHNGPVFAKYCFVRTHGKNHTIMEGIKEGYRNAWPNMDIGPKPSEEKWNKKGLFGANQYGTSYHIADLE